MSIPNLIEVQKNSYKQLTEFNAEVEIHLVKGFDRVFKGIFPIEDINDKATLNTFHIGLISQNSMWKNVYQEV